MGIQAKPQWITGAEFGEARRKLLAAGYDDDSPEMRPLVQRMVERNDYLWNTYAAPMIDEHRGEWAAVNLDGEVIFAPTASEVMAEATRRWGAANFVHGKMAEFRGHVLHRC